MDPGSIREDITMRRFTVVGILVVLLSACTTTGTTVREGDLTPTADAGLTLPLVLPELPKVLTATADLSLQSPLFTGTVTAHLKHRVHDSILVSFSLKGFGLEAARLLVTQDSFFVHDRIERTLTVGSHAADLVPDLFKPSAAMGRLLGLIQPRADLNWTIINSQDGIVLQDSTAQEQWIIDPALGRVVSLERSTDDSQMAEALYFADFAAFGEIVLPTRVTYRNPLNETSGQVYFRSVDTTSDIDDLSLGAPPGLERIELQ